MQNNIDSTQCGIFANHKVHITWVNLIYEGCSKFFHVENVIFAKKKITFAKL